ncbi:MAG: endonuclease domain-containing protein [Lewinellaceae bacterium]|nr:endonuclease domain-containing protein [Lewinellaceae bacterium]
MPRKIIPYEPYLVDLARQLRKNMTLSEVLLWNQLKNKQMLGFDFDRQKPLDRYIVDFYCKDLQLAIEIDGTSHDGDEQFKLDIKRQKTLELLGVHFLRFDDKDVKKNMTGVLFVIEEWIKKNSDFDKDPALFLRFAQDDNPSQEGIV